MNSLLIIHSSARVDGSLTRRLLDHAQSRWLERNPASSVETLDLALHAPPFVDESWVKAAYVRADQRGGTLAAALRTSDQYIDLLQQAHAIVIGAPVYNFGIPARLKAFLEQVIRLGRTFEIRRENADPYVGLLANKPVLVAVAAGSELIEKNSPRAHLNFLEPHLSAVLRLVGLSDQTFVAVGGQQGDRLKLERKILEAQVQIDQWTSRVQAPPIAPHRSASTRARPGTT